MKLYIFVAVLLIAAGRARSNPLPTVYDVIPCNGTGQPVCIEDKYTAPGPVIAYYQSLLTPSMFYNWFSSQHIDCSANPCNQVGGVGDVNNSGVAIGYYNHPQLQTPFIYDNGQIICCTDDKPAFLGDINDNGLVVGFDGIGPILAYCCSGPNSGQSSLPVQYLSLPDRFLEPYATEYLSIDDNNVILALNTKADQYYNLFPTPEPRSFTLLASVFAAVTLLLRRRSA